MEKRDQAEAKKAQGRRSWQEVLASLGAKHGRDTC